MTGFEPALQSRHHHWQHAECVALSPGGSWPDWISYQPSTLLSSSSTTWSLMDHLHVFAAPFKTDFHSLLYHSPPPFPVPPQLIWFHYPPLISSFPESFFSAMQLNNSRSKYKKREQEKEVHLIGNSCHFIPQRGLLQNRGNGSLSGKLETFLALPGQGLILGREVGVETFAKALISGQLGEIMLARNPSRCLTKVPLIHISFSLLAFELKQSN